MSKVVHRIERWSKQDSGKDTFDKDEEYQWVSKSPSRFDSDTETECEGVKNARKINLSKINNSGSDGKTTDCSPPHGRKVRFDSDMISCEMYSVRIKKKDKKARNQSCKSGKKSNQSSPSRLTSLSISKPTVTSKFKTRKV